MARPAAVTAAAVVAILGSVLAALFAVGFVFMAVSSTFQDAVAKQPSPALFRWMMVLMATFIGGMVAWGVSTAVGLLRMRNWARVSILVFAGLLAAMCLLMGGSTLAIGPLPTTIPAASRATFMTVMAVMYAIPFLIGVWWLVQFNLRSTRDAFVNADPSATAEAGRPLSMSVIGWFMVVGGVGCLVPLIAGFPGFVGGGILTGWAARAWYAAMGAAQLYGGTSLLQLRERGRLIAIAGCVLMLANGLAMELVPGTTTRLMDIERSRFPTLPATAGVATHSTVAAAAWVLILGLVPCWFLLRHRRAFRTAEA